MEPKEHLQNMLTNLINGNEQDANAAIHQYITAKSREIFARGEDKPSDIDEDE